MTKPSAKPRIVVDTNLFVSGTIIKRGKPHALLTAWRAFDVILLLSDDQYRELADVFSRPKLVDRYQLTPEELFDLFARLAAAPRNELISTLPVSVRDPKDEHILALALGAAADYLITGDDDLLELRDDPRLGSLQIMSVAEFLKLLDEDE